jgi:hypothetical protein
LSMPIGCTCWANSIAQSRAKRSSCTTRRSLLFWNRAALNARRAWRRPDARRFRPRSFVCKNSRSQAQDRSRLRGVTRDRRHTGAAIQSIVRLGQALGRDRAAGAAAARRLRRMQGLGSRSRCRHRSRLPAAFPALRACAGPAHADSPTANTYL